MYQTADVKAPVSDDASRKSSHWFLLIQPAPIIQKVLFQNNWTKKIKTATWLTENDWQKWCVCVGFGICYQLKFDTDQLQVDNL